MGPYLAKPETTIHSSHSENDRFIYCTAEMQGWRKTQEDAHTALLNYDDKGSAFFAVFDGHGGEEVAKYCALHLPWFIKKSSLYQDADNMLEALTKSFMEFDRSLKQPDVINELRKLASLDDMDEIEEDETVILRQEAQMPLEEVIQQGALSDIIPVKSDTAKNGESSKSVSEETVKKEDENVEEKPTSTVTSIESENAVNSSDNSMEKKNGEVAENDNHITKKEQGDGDGAVKKENSQPDKETQILPGPSSASSKLPKNAKSHALKALNKQIYEAFLNDFGSDEEEDDEDEENEFDSGSDEEDEEASEEGDVDDEDADDSDDDNEAHSLDPTFANAYITPGGGSGCTAVVALIRFCGAEKRPVLFVANVGDSRCVLSRDGTAIEMSEDHKPEDEREKTRIINAGGEVTADGRVNGGLNLSRAIGDHLYKKNQNKSDEEQMVTALPDIRTHEIDVEKDQFLFLACDGIWNSMTSQEAVDFINERIQKDVDLKIICEELFKACLAPNTDGDGSGCDNMTCVLVKFKKATDQKRTLDDSSADHSDEPEQKKNKLTDETDLFKPGPSRA